ncbi:polysaccharide deacetylase family protein [Solidesulfovibrio sp.]|uniref:polysaccharide deacetylase family protein n=1 Tax=Solidesulfovibrio sp. TaxID=2910990 RepID=UPI002B1FAF55|nr:polysaccharide deacetylase family protein [Solidesulfovibrio sp.]MEA5088404.1 polysaccharide deacetylase family protein [Solidesulfovibrio sp.]
MPPYGVMLHHFYDNEHPRGQGAISRDDFVELIDYIGRENILSAEEWKARALRGRLRDNDVCLTFDDALRCQYDVAFPVLRGMGLTGFWFVYSSVFENNIEPLEIYRYFRTTCFSSVDDFYGRFFCTTNEKYPDAYEQGLNNFSPETYLARYPFYTRNDKIFRYLRDDVLGPERYCSIMDEMVASIGMDIKSVAKKLWMTNEQLKTLKSQGHVVGLHSYSHPTRLSAMAVSLQRDEYQRNSEHLENILGTQSDSMSHPCNSYNQATLSILEDLGIKIGFRANMRHMSECTRFEFPREDHANIVKRMRA